MGEVVTLKRIISGGQTGADQAGLAAGAALKLETGGRAPKGWRTECGNEKWLSRYGLIADVSDQYPPRTRINIKDSDGTVIFAPVNSPGSKLTRKIVVEENKPYLVYDRPGGNPVFLKDWCEENGIEVLNVAGNRESICPGVFMDVLTFLVETFGEFSCREK